MELSLFGLKLVEIHLICTQISHSRLNCVIWQSKRTLKSINHSLRHQVCSSYLLSFTRTCILPLEPGYCPSGATDTVKLSRNLLSQKNFLITVEFYNNECCLAQILLEMWSHNTKHDLETGQEVYGINNSVLRAQSPGSDRLYVHPGV